MAGPIHTSWVNHSSAWYGKNLCKDTSWLVQFSADDRTEIAAAVKGVRAHGLTLAQVGRSTFPLPLLGEKLARHLEEIRTGRGFVVLRGLNAADYTDDEVGLIFWGVGAYLGSPVTQNPRGDLLGHVYDHGSRYGDIDVRGYETNAHLPFHSDGCDLVGLLCLRRAKSGGLSSIVSSITLHNEILRQHPEYLEPLYNGFHYIRREAALTDAPVTPHRVPVFGAKDGFISARLIRNQINAACAKTGNPLAPQEREALDFLDSLAYDEDIHLDMDLQVGDMQLCNNYTILHSRTGFEDYPEPERRRHMIRLWLTCRERRPLAAGFAPHNGYGRNETVEVALQPASAA
ncbi:MAG TPA: TauD/TfdA family dioxygenase [Acetobacteraceae bacterium]|nr:TauD/TfdA family dioxygenase [Acetobacteraceae bacterium]